MTRLGDLRRSLGLAASLIQGTRAQVGAAVLLAIGQAATLLPIALLVRHVFDVDVPEGDEVGIVVRGLAAAACYLLSAALVAAGRAYAARAAKVAVGRTRRELIDALASRSLCWHEGQTSGALHSVVVQDGERVERMVSILTSQVVPSAATLLTLGVVAIVINPLLSALLAVVLAVMLLVVGRLATEFQLRVGAWHESSAAFSAHTHVLLDTLATMRAAGADRRDRERFDAEITSLTDATYRAALAGSRYQALQGATAAIAGIAVLVAGGVLVARDDLTFGGLLAFYAVIALMMRQLSVALTGAPFVIEGLAASERVAELAAAAEPDGYDGTRAIEFRGGIELDQVTFRYVGAERDTLADLSLRVDPGEVLAVVGASGAGKSTLAAVMLGLRRPQSGRVLADGVPLTDLDLVSAAPADRSGLAGRRALRRDRAGERPALCARCRRVRRQGGAHGRRSGRVRRRACVRVGHRSVERGDRAVRRAASAGRAGPRPSHASGVPDPGRADRAPARRCRTGDRRRGHAAAVAADGRDHHP